MLPLFKAVCALTWPDGSAETGGRCTRSAPSPPAHFLCVVRPGASRLLAVLAVVLALAAPAVAQDGTPPEPCPGNADPPTPTEVAFTEVPIMVASTTDDYFVLYVTHEVDGTEIELPVAVKRGAADTTTLAENIPALPAERYRVEKYAVAAPADVDGDCLDDLTELGDATGMNPVNPAAAIDISNGAVAVPDQAALDTLTSNALKFVLLGMDTARPSVYFMNTRTHPHHREFLSAVGLDWTQPGISTGWIIHYPQIVAPDGNRGVYAYNPSRAHRFSLLDLSHTVLAASLPLLEDNLAYYIPEVWLPGYQAELALYEQSRINPVFIDDIRPIKNFIALNEAEGYGLLRVMEPGERPHSRDIVLYEALPNNLPRVAGIISTVPQTPLSHVNLRAVQDRIPNAYIRDARDKPDIDGLTGRHVHYAVHEFGYTIRAATQAEVEAHYEASRPAEAQTPQRDLASFTAITPLSAIGFEHWKAFGVKAANVAVLGKLGFPAGTVPDGFAIPFYFYDEFMTHNGFYDDIDDMLEMQGDPASYPNFDLADKLKKLRDAIEDAETPEGIIDAIEAMNTAFDTAFGAGLNRRYRSSTNNEDLPGFSGAGLYDSKSQKPKEDEKDLAKSLKEVYASLWNFRAFTEREFHRIDHKATAMGILVHPSYQDELVNGVAVSFDPAYGSNGTYYVNSQVGEDLVTNPDALSVPEELLLKQDGTRTVLSTSNQTWPGQLLMMDAQLDQLRRHLTTIHDHFKTLYTPAAGERFAMEIEFKITSDDILAIKQARPWVFETARPSSDSDEDSAGDSAGDSSGGSGENSGGSGSSSGGGGSSGGGSSSGGGGSSSGGGGSGGSGGSGGGGGGGGSSRDDHGNTPTQATAVPLGATAPWPSSTPGQLTPADDVDYFTLTVPQAGVLVVETTGATDTVGTVWQDGEEIAMAARGGVRQNFRLSVRVGVGPVVIAVAGTGRRTGSYTLETTLVAGYLENPGSNSFQSGIGVISGWVCEAETVEIEINGRPQAAAYGTERVDTRVPCGDTDNGFGLLFNWNRLGDGEHEVVARVDDVELERATVRVTTLGAEFVEAVAGTCEVEDFPSPGEGVRLAWQQPNQNFVLAEGLAPTGENRAGVAGVGYLENPGPASFQSGIGVISGWVCEATGVEIELGDLPAQVAAYGTERADTLAVCGDTDNGFGVLFNWNRLGEGVHTVRAVVDEVELGRATVRVTTLGAEFVEGAAGVCEVADFPGPGETVTLEWQQNSQNFVITDVE